MPAFKNRIKRLEYAFRGTGNYTEDQWDGILLMCLAQCVPEHIVAMIRTAAIYPWAAQWYAKRQEEKRHWSDEQREAAANRQWPEHLRNAFSDRIVEAWKRQIPGVPLSTPVVDGELRVVESAVCLPEESAGQPAS